SGGAIAAALMGYLVTWFDWQTAFFVLAALQILAAALFMKIDASTPMYVGAPAAGSRRAARLASQAAERRPGAAHAFRDRGRGYRPSSGAEGIGGPGFPSASCRALRPEDRSCRHRCAAARRRGVRHRRERRSRGRPVTVPGWGGGG